ncbi:MAG: zinc-ribbon domain-containing protein [Candidatus Lokiarchaeota archaeon]|nr:zinc-ribbon domain-containing protein [Candidatus Lokiarchaeota archaeon]
MERSSENNVYDEILRELENSFKEGKIDEDSYHDLKQQYSKQMEEQRTFSRDKMNNMDMFGNIKVLGSQTVTPDEINIAGSARLPGGSIRKSLRVSGSCKILDQIELNGIRCSGWVRSAGSIQSHGDVHVSGALKADGSVSVLGNMEVSGSAKANGDIISTGLIKVSGSMKVQGSVNGKKGVWVSGRSKTEGSLYSDADVVIKGLVKVEGNVIAEHVKFKVPNDVQRLFRRLWCSHVEGNILGRELVDIENIHVGGHVRGRVVKIGKNSKIDGKIQYVDEIFIAEDVKLEKRPIRITSLDLGVPDRSHDARHDRFDNTSESVSQPLTPKFCPKCGQEVGEGKKFCPACGSSLLGNNY